MWAFEKETLQRHFNVKSNTQHELRKKSLLFQTPGVLGLVKQHPIDVSNVSNMTQTPPQQRKYMLVCIF